jgi:hypothetical protein
MQRKLLAMKWSQGSLPTTDVPGSIPPRLPSMVLVPLCDSLCVLNTRVADEFLALAAVLQSNSTRARQITAESHKATGSEANLQSSRSIAILQQILTESAGVSGMVEISTEQMLEILSIVNAERAPLQKLAKMRGLLQTVGVMSRIEGARIKNTFVDLSSLSRDIDVLAGEVQQHVERIVDDASRLVEVLQSGVRELNSFGQQERMQAADLIRRTQAVLSPMIARTEISQAAARNIDEQYTNFHRATDKVVMSLQSEDIARQRVEHVQEAIRRIATSMDAGESMESCAGMVALQRSQLLGTRDLLADSIRTITAGLQSLGPRIQELVSRTAVLAQQADEDGRSFATVIENGLETVSDVFTKCSSSVQSALAIVGSVVPQVEEMIQGAWALDEIQASIHLLSLNAKVKSGNLGDEGVAMEVLASELHSINQNSKGDTKVVLDGLAAINGCLARITSEGGIAEDSFIMSSRGDVSSELTGLSQSVRTSSQEMAVGLNEVRQLAEELCAELKQGCELALRAASIIELFEEQICSFDEAFWQVGYTKEMSLVVAAGNQVNDLSNLYSMDSERKLHQEIFGGDASGVECTPATSALQQNCEFGDDVELF